MFLGEAIAPLLPPPPGLLFNGEYTAYLAYPSISYPTELREARLLISLKLQVISRIALGDYDNRLLST